jgi:hypothetical protein
VNKYKPDAFAPSPFWRKDEPSNNNQSCKDKNQMDQQRRFAPARRRIVGGFRANAIIGGNTHYICDLSN